MLLYLFALPSNDFIAALDTLATEGQATPKLLSEYGGDIMTLVEKTEFECSATLALVVRETRKRCVSIHQRCGCITCRDGFVIVLCSQKNLAEKSELLQRLGDAEVQLQSLWTQAQAHHDAVKDDCESSPCPYPYRLNPATRSCAHVQGKRCLQPLMCPKITARP